MADSPSQPRPESGHRTPRWVYGLLMVAIVVAAALLILHFIGMGSTTHVP